MHHIFQGLNAHTHCYCGDDIIFLPIKRGTGTDAFYGDQYPSRVKCARKAETNVRRASLLERDKLKTRHASHEKDIIRCFTFFFSSVL